MDYTTLFTDDLLSEVFPPSRADDFFEALFGEVEEGAFDISLNFISHDPEADTLHFELQLTERPGKCLVCNLTYGLPTVFTRHPVIDISGAVKKIEESAGGTIQCTDWQLGDTKTVRTDLHTIPLVINITS